MSEMADSATIKVDRSRFDRKPVASAEFGPAPGQYLPAAKHAKTLSVVGAIWNGFVLAAASCHDVAMLEALIAA